MNNHEYVDQVASRIIEQLKTGTAPWIKPWEPGQRSMPFNPTTGNDYKGMNALWLMSQADNRGYQDSRWMTFKQASQVDARINKGEKGTTIQYWQWDKQVPATDAEGKPLKDPDGKPVLATVRLQVPRCFNATVFNASQMSGIEPETRSALPAWERHEQAERILSQSEADIQFQAGNRAFYQPRTDRIVLPERGQFPTADNFYATALHELGHWTGHESRLNRDLVHPFGSDGYAKEELRAEISSLMLGDRLSIGHDPSQHVAYIGSWVKALEEDPYEIFRAASDAEKIQRFVMAFTQEQGQTHEMAGRPDESVNRGGTIDMPKIPQTMASERVYLAVPYSEKEQAKKHGAQYDRQAKCWYAPSGLDLEPLSRWQVEPNQSLSGQLEPVEAFANALQSAGLIMDSVPIMNGKLYRVKVEGDTQQQKSGAYAGFLDGHPAGFIQNYKTGQKTNWKYEGAVTTLSEADKARLAAEAAQKQALRELETNRRQTQTADQVRELWNTLKPVDQHLYLSNKGVASHGLRLNTQGALALSKPDGTSHHWSGQGQLLIPVQDTEGVLWSAQSIDAQGQKSFPFGGKLQGCFHTLGQFDGSDKILIAEGYATGATLHEVSGLPVAVAFNAGNLAPVAQALKAKYPDKTLFLAGDNDHHKPKELNVGLHKAQEAAQLVKGNVLLPQFEKGTSGTDWNDLCLANGKDAVLSQIQSGLKASETKVLADQLTLKQQQALKGTTLKPDKSLVQTGSRGLSR